ncbi:hypothetical protein DSM19430T_28950 [Desulfovibrio psychrotolerans]|uniref:Uncharacterized protein n=1 Tax=Desulfovibrio psychrotolerans TaxID=415242 RepID=A0A7J0BYH7_9BACT|nr:hypothetical protein DSM19430T_28950 [Desulfovibrio psychrotolerans]
MYATPPPETLIPYYMKQRFSKDRNRVVSLPGACNKLAMLRAGRAWHPAQPRRFFHTPRKEQAKNACCSPFSQV